MISKNRNALNGVSCALTVFPLAFAMGVCTDLGVSCGIVAAVTAGVFGAFSRDRLSLRPSWFSFLLFSLISSICGAGTAFVALCVAGALTVLFTRFSDNTLARMSTPAVVAGVTLASALVMTGMQTTNYFGIGARGSSFTDIIGDYVSLGFHGNWLGVLYGTVTLVIMITYPRKFKSFSNKLPASFVSLAVTLALNALLNPDVGMTAISEAGKYSLTLGDIFSGALFSGFVPDAGHIIFAIAAAVPLSLAVTHESVKNGCDKKDRVRSGLCLCLCGVLGGVPVVPIKDERCTDRSNAVSAVCVAAIYILAMPLCARLPVPTLAVILIVTAWQAVNWGKVKLAFMSGARELCLFIVAAVSVTAIGLPLAMYTLPLVCIFFGNKTTSALVKESEGHV